jgi:hypothetical protein
LRTTEKEPHFRDSTPSCSLLGGTEWDHSRHVLKFRITDTWGPPSFYELTRGGLVTTPPPQLASAHSPIGPSWSELFDRPAAAQLANARSPVGGRPAVEDERGTSPAPSFPRDGGNLDLEVWTPLNQTSSKGDQCSIPFPPPNWTLNTPKPLPWATVVLNYLFYLDFHRVQNFSRISVISMVTKRKFQNFIIH